MDIPARFTRRELLSQGISPAALRTQRFRRAAQGWYAPRGEDGTAGYTRILDAAAILPPGGLLGGWAAAHLLGASDLDGQCSVTGHLLPIPMFVPPSCGMRSRRGLIVRRDCVTDEDRSEVFGIPVTARLRTAYDLARSPGLERALVLVDSFLRTGGVTPEDLTAYVAARMRDRGLVQARAVTGLMDAHTRSPQESRLRLLWVLDARIPTPRVNCTVYAVDGWFLAIPDLLEEESGLVAEYDGGGHREARQHAHDNAREELLEQHGLIVVRASAADLGARRAAFIHRLRAAYDRAKGTSPRERLWTLHPASPWGLRSDRAKIK